MKLFSKKDGENIKAILRSESTEEALGIMEFYLGGFEKTNQRDKSMLDCLSEKNEDIRQLRDKVVKLQSYMNVICKHIALTYLTSDRSKKIACIKKIREVSGWDLMTSKKFVEETWDIKDLDKNYSNYYEQFHADMPSYRSKDEM